MGTDKSFWGHHTYFNDIFNYLVMYLIEKALGGARGGMAGWGGLVAEEVYAGADNTGVFVCVWGGAPLSPTRPGSVWRKCLCVGGRHP